MHPRMKARRAKMAGEAVATEEVVDTVETEVVEDEVVEDEVVEDEVVEDEVNIEDQTEEMDVAELRDRAADLDISGRSTMRKAELVQAINEAEGDA